MRARYLALVAAATHGLTSGAATRSAQAQPPAPVTADHAPSCARGLDLSATRPVLASAHLSACRPDDPNYPRAEAARTAIERADRRGALAKISFIGEAGPVVLTSPALRQHVDTPAQRAPELHLHAPAEVWLPAGDYQFTSTAGTGFLRVHKGAPATVLLEAPRQAKPAPTHTAHDFSDDPVAPPMSGQPPPERRASMLPAQVQKALALQQLHGDAPERAHRAVIRLGLEAGGGLGRDGTAWFAAAYAQRRLSTRWALQPSAGWYALHTGMANVGAAQLRAEVAVRPWPNARLRPTLSTGPGLVLRVHGEPARAAGLRWRTALSIAPSDALELALSADAGLSAWLDGARVPVGAFAVRMWW